VAAILERVRIDQLLEAIASWLFPEHVCVNIRESHYEMSQSGDERQALPRV
jgi:hypothetical protein